MISVITGKIGGGKTLLALTQMLDHLAKGGCVISNVALHPDKVARHLLRTRGKKLLKDQLRHYDFEANPEFQGKIPWGIPSLPVLVVCDEAHLYYNAALAAKLTAQCMTLVSFLTQSRKASVDVVFITQDDKTLWTQFRNQALFGYRCRDMRSVNLPFVGKASFLGLNWVKFDVQSGEIMERGRTPLSPKLFGLYDTFQMYDSQMTELQKAAEIWDPAKRNEHHQINENENNPDIAPISLWTWLLRN